jgi:hypothetical protein
VIEERGMVFQDQKALGPVVPERLEELEFGARLVLPERERDTWNHELCEGKCLQPPEQVSIVM